MSTLVGIYTITPLHCGTGQAVGAIDLPIAREAHTGHPLIPATSLKGRLREIAVRQAAIWGTDGEKTATAIFGPKTGEGDLHAGALTVSDARLVAFPVRSLQEVFYWVTCPMVLSRCVRDLKAAEIAANPPAASAIDKVQAAKAGEGLLVLEDLAYSKEEVAWGSGAAKGWAQWLQGLIPEHEPNRSRLSTHLVLVSDVDFADLVTRTTPVTARIALSDKTKTSENLWYEETLPSDCLFYALLRPYDARSPATVLDRNAVEQRLKQLPLSPLQIGGNETVGHGWCHWQWV